MIWIDLAGILDVLSNQDFLLGVFLVGAGLVFMLFGFRVSRSLVSVSFGVMGFVLCGSIPVSEEFRIALGFAGAIGLGVASMFFPKTSLALLAAAWAAYAGIVIASKMEMPREAIWGVGAVAAAAMVSLTLIMAREVTAFTMSLEGTVLLIGGLVIFLNQSPLAWTHVRDLLVTSPIFAPFILLAGTVTGFYWQLAELRQRDAGSSG